MKRRGSARDMAHEEIKDFYNCEYYGASTGDSKLPWHMRVVAHRLGDLQGRHVLDVACGTGVWLAELASRGAHVAGLDISDRAVEVCTRRIPQAEVATGVAEDLPFGNARFDLVTCLGALEHFIDQPEALSEMRRVAKPSAQLLILVPNAGFLTRRFGLYQGTQQAAVQETVRSIEEWRALFASAGLVVTALWRDLHPLSSGWIARGPLWQWPIRIAQAAVLPVWPLSWQYQIYFLCRLGRG